MKPTRRFVWMLAALLIAGVGTRAADQPAEDLAALSQRLSGVAERCRAATVGVVIPGGGMGSGVIIDAEGLVLTAAHVLPEPGGDVVIVMPDGRQLPARALGVNRRVDSGMARITAPGAYRFAEVADGAGLWEGDWCIAFGHGGGVQTDRLAPMRLGRILHISSGSSPIRWITTDCTVVSGDSGGPLFDLDGRVIAIHSNIGMSVLVNRHVPIGSYHAQWDRLLEPGEINEPPAPAEPPVPGLGEDMPDGVAREIARRLSDGDEALRAQLDAHRDEAGNITLSPEQVAELLGHNGILEEIRAYQEKIAERDQRTRQIEGVDADDDDQEQSEVSRLSQQTRLLILEKRRERMLDDIAQDLRRTHGKVADHVLSRFQPAVSSAGPTTAQVLCFGRVVALGTVVRGDGYLVTKASELNGPARVRLDGQEYPAVVVNGDGAHDLALLKINAKGLAPMRWADHAPMLGELLVTPDAERRPLALGVVGVDARPIPERLSNLFIPPPPAPYLGVGGLERDEHGGARLGTVVPDTPAASAGLQDGDTVTAIDGEAIDGPDALVQRIGQAEIGQTLALTVRRGEQTLELGVTLGERPARPEPPQDDRQTAAQVLSSRGGALSDRRTGFPLALQHDAVIWATDIGGPVLNLDGEAVGLNIARYGRTTTYAIPAEQARQTIEQMMRGR